MTSKAKASETKVPILKGQEAEDKILDYLRSVNRPYGAVDVSANLKGAVPKTATQKILMTFAEKGELVMKTYGKTTFFVANQANIEAVSCDKFKELEDNYRAVEEANKLVSAEIKTLTSELGKLKNTPTDSELDAQTDQTHSAIELKLKHLMPLRAGTTLVSSEEIAQIDSDWTKWRAEWVRRRKIFTIFWQMVTDSLPPQEADRLSDDLGIELDTTEHLVVEEGLLCTVQSSSLKRKR